MSLNNKKIQEEFRKLLEFKDDDEKLQFEIEMLHLSIMKKIFDLMNENKMNKSQLAKKLHTSKGYITQLFMGDKIINLKTLAKIQRIFGVSLKVEFEKKLKIREDLENNEVHYMNDYFEVHPENQKTISLNDQNNIKNAAIG